jgi:hypothetical protein
MSKKVLVSLIILVFLTACGGGGNRSEPYEVVSEVIERGPDYQAITFSQSQVLPPYGIHVSADLVELGLHVSTTQKGTLERMEDIQLAIDTIASLAANDESISLAETSVEGVSGSYGREDVSAENVQTLDTSTISLKLTTELSQHDGDFIQSVEAFNEFLNGIDLPDTLAVQAVSVGTELEDLESYRQQVIEQVYQELDAVRAEYGEDVVFEISGLYAPLQMMQLSDVDYYLYLEPVVVVSEF